MTGPYYHVSGGKAYGPSKPGETLPDYKRRVKAAYGNLSGVVFGTKESLHPATFYQYGL